ncbi:cellulose biosynthesis protein BcsQ [Gayadomonas joobiniege]|uniref:cellulose biosynthesis protein BcsQ n=1 Tax=Gayadomonas joobiniege TaxID=1234606 RepID=UPI00037C1190|nr:cellulose biosynthesis protein BcsQ [Gayadomonas joobiniege]
MPHVFVIGSKGGTGTSSVAANLARSIRLNGETSVLIELCPQNQLGVHFALPWPNVQGWAQCESFVDLAKQFYRTDSDILLLPYGQMANGITPDTLFTHLKQIELPENAWFIFDCPKTFPVFEFASRKDFIIEVSTCDPICHSILYQKYAYKNYKPIQGHYILVNKYNAQSQIEAEIFCVWQNELNQLCPLFIHFDEAIKEAPGYQNQAVQTHPGNTCRADFAKLSSWLASKVSQQ